MSSKLFIGIFDGDIKEPLINSGRNGMKFKIINYKARIAGNSQTIAKIHNAVVDDFGFKAFVHGLIRGSL